jgi:predicted SnoaL-like aldol condensation-catalyzing enzyme
MEAMSPLEVVRTFNDAVDRMDVAAIGGLVTGDVRFESTDAPDGVVYRGRDEMVEFWTAFFDANPEAHFEVEEEIAVGDRVVTRWTYRWSSTGRVRGVDLFRVEGDAVAEKLSYVKG